MMTFETFQRNLQERRKNFFEEPAIENQALVRFKHDCEGMLVTSYGVSRRRVAQLTIDAR